MKKHRTKIIIGVIVVAVLAVSLFWGGFNDKPVGGDTPDTSVPADTPVSDQSTAVTTPVSPATQDASVPVIGTTEQSPGASAPASNTTATPTPATDTPPTDTPSSQPPAATYSAPPTETQPPPGSSVPPETPATPGTPEQTDDGELTCTLVISCATVLDNMDKLREGMESLIPADGIIFSKTVIFYEGENVFDVLRRETKAAKIHLEYVNAPIYGSAYIEGIGNLYEFDCGERSGWMYSVNGTFPNYGSSKYTLSAGDRVEWLYTCDRGDDIGGGEAADSYVKE